MTRKTEAAARADQSNQGIATAATRVRTETTRAATKRDIGLMKSSAFWRRSDRGLQPVCGDVGSRVSGRERLLCQVLVDQETLSPATPGVRPNGRGLGAKGPLELRSFLESYRPFVPCNQC
jgi:hypothetical protein